MFAPTYRDSIKGKQSSQVDINECLQCLKENGENWICLVRAHSSSKGLSVDLNESIIDVSHKYDMTDLLLISDCLITDYSSCAGDFILTNRPCILAQFDRDEYENHSRELWIDPDETGFLIAKTQEELNHILENLYSYNHTEIAQKVNQFYGTHETGNSSVITAKKIINWMNKNHS